MSESQKIEVLLEAILVELRKFNQTVPLWDDLTAKQEAIQGIGKRERKILAAARLRWGE